jgi:hypothetical protein
VEVLFTFLFSLFSYFLYYLFILLFSLGSSKEILIKTSSEASFDYSMMKTIPMKNKPVRREFKIKAREFIKSEEVCSCSYC